MYRQEVCRLTGLTKKALEYYIAQGVVCPALLDNGYRSFSQQDVEWLKKVSVYRKLGISVQQIKLLQQQSNQKDTLRRMVLKKQLYQQNEQKKQQLLLQYCDNNCTWNQLREQVELLEQQQSILQRLLDAFPGYYGVMFSMHFAPFLQEPFKTDEQKQAYLQIVQFLDQLPPLHLSVRLQQYLEEIAGQLSFAQAEKSTAILQQMVEQPEKYLKEHKDEIETYLAIQQSEEYQNFPAYQLQQAMRDFCNSSGYNTVFLPAMQKLSPSYSTYYQKLLAANEILLQQYPILKDEKEKKK